MNASSIDALTRNLAAWPERLPRPERTGAELTRVDVSSSSGVLTLLAGDRWIPLHSQRDPLREAERALAACNPAGASTIFVVGFGLGYVADVLEQQQWPGAIVALEPDAGSVSACLARRDWTAWIANGRLGWAWAPEYRTLDAVTLTLRPDRDDPLILVNPVLARCQPAWVEAATRRAEAAWFGARANNEAKRRMAGRYLLNTLRNTGLIAAAGDVSSLAGQLAGMPVIVAAAGPSLDRNLGELAAHRDKAVLMAVDTALRPLLTAGLAPDLVVAVDPTEANARHLVDLPSCESTFLVAEGSVDPEAMRTFATRLATFRVADHHPWPWLSAQGVHRGRLRAWGSVLTTAFDLALSMGCDPIVFVGADLAFTDGRPYARGTTYEEDWRRDVAGGQRLEDTWRARVEEWVATRETAIGGGLVATAPHLVAFRDWLVAEASKATGRTVLNATGRGILHGPAILQSTIATALAGHAPVHARTGATLASALQTPPPSTLWEPGPVSADTDREWCAFAGVTQSDWRRALGRDTTAVGAEGSEEAPSVAATPPRDPAWYPDLSDADARYLLTLSRSHRLQEVTLRDASQDLVDHLRRAVSALTHTDAVVVIDALGTTVGAQVRRAINVVLCERTDVWLDYRRFIDPVSRVSVLRLNPSDVALELGTIEAPLWQPDHAAVADSLAPLIVADLEPTSLIHIGCGAGYWLRAFERAGVTRLCGVTMQAGGETVHPAVTALDSNELLSGMRGILNRGGDRFDVCLALEVPQQLPASAHAAFVAACARLSDVVVWSYRRPGTPGATPYARPLPYWSDLFWREGFVIEDRLRQQVEERWAFPRTVYDGLLICRRTLTVEEREDARLRARQRDLVERLHELYEQSLWRAIHTFAVEAVSPRSAMVASFSCWTVPAWRWLGATGPTRRLVFRTDAARCYVTHPRSDIAVSEGGRPLPRARDLDELDRSSQGGWVLADDELFVKSTDGTDPRNNRRGYTVRLPAFAAWAESQSLSECLSTQL